MTTPRETTEGERLARIETAVESLVREVDGIKGDIRDLRTDMRDLRTDLGSLNAKVDRNFLWTIGIMLVVMIPMWVSLFVAIVLET